MKELTGDSKTIDEKVRELIEESKAFRAEMRADRKEIDKQWAALAQKMGTIDEDLVVPDIESILDKYFNCKLTTRTIRVLKQMGDEYFEVDVLVIANGKVFMIEVRSTPRVAYVDEIIEKAKQFRKFFPEYEDKELIPIFASIIFPENVVKYASKTKLYVMAYREWEYMDIINFDEVAKG